MYILNNIRWTEALSLCEEKSTIFCIDSIELIKRKGSRLGRAIPLLCPLRCEETRSST
ncbi:unnamed protein product [Penicillium roqueforti FM164]|uniref:Genomic scaffold, ProqFM164S02 n=1 Tax=Penicillium roqueforti (strain FM164) TaxID=1365484 RepID=W6Q884_PENRF|nr:unnamed protein product [Penicillium roqueforti FM164]